MSVKVHVNKQVIYSNLKHGTDKPPIAIRRSSTKIEYAHEVELIGKARIVYRPKEPLKCGARSWIEAEDAIGMVREEP